jgi:hypothetical protein
MQKSPLRIAVNNLTPEQKRAEQLANMLMEKRFVVYKLPKNKNHEQRTFKSNNK